MALETLRLILKIRAIIHNKTYISTENPKHVLIIGGSFAGIQLAKRLAETLPTGYKVILIEKNSHFNYTFNFPRYSVVRGRQERAFIPYDGLGRGNPVGVFEQIRGTVVKIREDEVVLEDRRIIGYEFLAVATGVTQAPPAKLLACEKTGACGELKALQDRIFESNTIAIVGAGAVGVQLACDIKTFYPDKVVTLIHSRKKLLTSFGRKLHDYVFGKLGELGIEVLLGERPSLTANGDWKAEDLTFQNGSKRLFDLIIPCTGQSPNSSLLASFSPSSISFENGQILVKPTLQIITDSKLDSESCLTNIFALGDVADTGGAKMARAGMMQAQVVCSNIIASISGGKMKAYNPSPLEGSLKLSLGKDNGVGYLQDSDGTEILVPLKGGKVDFEVGNAWWHLGAKYDEKNF